MSTIQFDYIKRLKKGDEKAFPGFFTWTPRDFMEVEEDLTPDWTVSENCEAGMNSFQKKFPGYDWKLLLSSSKSVKSKQGSWATSTQYAGLSIFEKENIKLKKKISDWVDSWHFFDKFH